MSGSNLPLQSCQKSCPKHNDPLKVFCETCHKVICRDCTISEEHNKHKFELISECYPKCYKKIDFEVEQLRQKVAESNETVTAFVTREREVLQQGEEIKEQIHTHAQQLIDQIQRSESHLLQQVDTIVERKQHTLALQREQIERVLTLFNECVESVDQCLKEWNEQQVLMQKQQLLERMNKVSQHAYLLPAFQPVEKANIEFTKGNSVEAVEDFGKVKSNTFGNATLTLTPYLLNKSKSAILNLDSLEGLPLTLPHFLIACNLYSPCDSKLTKCDITQAEHGKYNITFPSFTHNDHKLIVKIGGVDVPGSPFKLPQLARQKSVKKHRIKGPWGLADYGNGCTIVVENSAHCISILNSEGEKVNSYGSRGTRGGHFTHPRGIAISSDKHIFVTDDHRVQKLTYDGVWVKSVGTSDKGNGTYEFNHPMGIAIHSTTGQIFIADSWNNRIQVFDNDLTFSHTITANIMRSSPHPYDVALDSEGCLYIAVYDNHCITKLSITGQFVAKFGSKGSDPGQLWNPCSLTIDKVRNLLYVSENCNNRVSVFNTRGGFIRWFGEKGSGQGELHRPHGLRVDVLGKVHVSDSYNDRIVVF